MSRALYENRPGMTPPVPRTCFLGEIIKKSSKNTHNKTAVTYLKLLVISSYVRFYR